MNSAGDVLALVTDPRLVEERRGQIVRAAVKLFSEEGYYTTTIQQIARAAGVSTGLIYQYFRDKDDILFLTLKLVLDTYEHDIPPQLEGIEHPVERLCKAIWAYCGIVDGLLDATVLAYRSTKSLRADRRGLVKDAETRTNGLIEDCIAACVAGGHMREVNAHLLSYQLVMFAHSWALKHWSLGERYSLAEYVSEGVRILVEPFLTARGRRVLDAMRERTGSFGSAAAKAVAKPRAGKARSAAGRRRTR
ncbi:MAG: HTH-type transcriptional regulator BetI [Rhodocyclaceae bacterium]|nr:MAG: TetR/AcrR family transcriptional regulator [Rhodocyclaceae bacterium]MBE7422942.1 TetR/AcrR family transcriptional regulator [Zoogloeaceae bacterium]MBV6408480.1 HTH-type transcriptional regulator BetI [Rhodocyclaceae bacterium]MCK6385757.1 TetR/AcrR family transcriptional regulator [Rhodocyclaceae bacterium]CAG0929621.1 HTH-type transcriptional regulator BetI [Rhodocyclaceae bacterium]